MMSLTPWICPSNRMPAQPLCNANQVYPTCPELTSETFSQTSMVNGPAETASGDVCIGKLMAAKSLVIKVKAEKRLRTNEKNVRHAFASTAAAKHTAASKAHHTAMTPTLCTISARNASYP